MKNHAVASLAAEQHGVLSRRQLYALGVTRWQVVANVRAGRWQRIGDQSVCIVSVPRGAKVRRTAAFDIRQTRRWSAADVPPSGVPRTRADVAAVRAALWTRSDRQAVLVVTMSVQQGITTAKSIGHQLMSS